MPLGPAEIRLGCETSRRMACLHKNTPFVKLPTAVNACTRVASTCAMLLVTGPLFSISHSYS